MPPVLERLVARLVNLRSGEGSTALLMFAYSFLAMTAYNVLRPVTRSQVIGSLGAENLPYIQFAAGLLIGVLMQGYGRLAGVLPRRWLIPISQSGEVVLLLAFWLLFMTDAAWVSVAFYLLGLILGILLISQFWTLANDIYDPRQAKRLFGFIGGGASLGGATGAAITAVAVDVVGTNNLLLVSAALLAVCVVIVARLIREHERAGSMPAVERGTGGGEALRLVLGSRHLQVIALVISAAALGAGIIEQQLNMAAESIGGAGATDTITEFLARVTFYVSVVGFVIQVGLTSRIHRTLGLGVALLMLPIGLGGTAVVILATGAIWAPAVARVFDASLRYTIDKTTREVLFLPLPSYVMHRAKPFVDVTVDRMAKAIGALVILVLIKPWGFGLDWRQLSYASLTVTAGWIVLALVARREYLSSFRHSLEDRVIAPAAVRLDVADGRTIEALVEELSSPNDESVLYAIDLLETLDQRHLITPLLLHHQSPQVRARVLAGFEMARPDIRDRWAPHVEGLLRDDEPSVRAAAVQALSALGMGSAAVTMRRYLDDDDPRVAATAAAVLAGSDDPEDVRLADTVFTRLTSDVRPSAATSRREAATALGRVRNATLRRLLLVLARDPDTGVVRDAVRAMQASGARDPMFAPVLVSLLGHRGVKRQAREALLDYGPDLVPLLGYILADHDEQPWVRRHIPATLARVGSQAAMDVLVPALKDPDGFVRYKTLEALEALHRADDTLTFDVTLVEQQIVEETTRYYTTFVLRRDLAAAGIDADVLVARVLDGRLRRVVDRIYRLIALVYPWRDVSAARFTREHGNARARASAVEYLDNLLGGALRRRVMPIVDDSSPEETTRQAYSILGTRPRDLEDALAQLIHDRDPLTAAAAILHVAADGPDTLWPDIEFVHAHRSPEARQAWEAAAWVLETSRGARPRGRWRRDLPAVAVADRLRRIPLFGFVSIPELCRIAEHGRQRVYTAGQRLFGAGHAVRRASFLVAGSARRETAGAPAETVAAPAALGVEAVLEGRPSRRSVMAVTDVTCFEVEAPDLLAILGESTQLAQGVFRTLLSSADFNRWERLSILPGEGTMPVRAMRTPVDLARLIREHPLFRRATVLQLRGIAGLVREVVLPAGAELKDEPGMPALHQVVAGGLEMHCPPAEPLRIGPGRTLGVVDVLTGESSGWRAVAVTETRVLQIQGRELFEWLTDHVDLLQSLFGAVLAAARAEPAPPAGTGVGRT